jgi:type I site-specific restriction endonuclease
VTAQTRSLLLGVLGIVYGADLALSAGDVPRGVSVAGVSVGGMSHEDAEARLRDELEPRFTQPVEVIAGDTEAALDPAEAGLNVDWPATLDQAVQPIAANPELREQLVNVQRSFEQVVDEISIDHVTRAEFAVDARARAAETVESFKAYLDEHKDEITALQVLYSRPYPQRLTYRDVKELAGSYSFDEFDDVTEVTYEIAIDPGFPVPGLLKRQAERQIVKGALEDLKKRVESG